MPLRKNQRKNWRRCAGAIRRWSETLRTPASPEPDVPEPDVSEPDVPELDVSELNVSEPDVYLLDPPETLNPEVDVSPWDASPVKNNFAGDATPVNKANAGQAAMNWQTKTNINAGQAAMNWQTKTNINAGQAAMNGQTKANIKAGQAAMNWQTKTNINAGQAAKHRQLCSDVENQHAESLNDLSQSDSESDSLSIKTSNVDSMSIIEVIINELLMDTLNQIMPYELNTQPRKGKLKPGKFPFVRKRNLTSDSESSSSEFNSKKKIKKTKRVHPKAHIEMKTVPNVKKYKKTNEKNTEYTPGKPHNIFNFKKKNTPKTRPFSKPRSKVAFNAKKKERKAKLKNPNRLSKAQQKKKLSKKTSKTKNKVDITCITNLPNKENLNVVSDNSGSESSDENVVVSQNMIDNHQPPVIQGHFHQAHPQFGQNSGKQCVANSLFAMVLNKQKPVHCWNSSDMDQILYTGNELYSDLRRLLNITHDHILVTELPHMIEVNNTIYSLNRGESKTGMLRATQDMEENDIMMNLDMALQSVFSEHNACFITFGMNTFAVIQSQDSYFTFDSHSRNENGLFGVGASIAMRKENLFQVYEHCLNLSASLQVPPNSIFEVTGMTVDIVNQLTNNVLSHDTSADESDQPDHETSNVNTSDDGSSSNTENEISSDEIVMLSDENDNSDVEIIDEQLGKCFYYPLSKEEMKQICCKLGITCQLIDERSIDVQKGVEISEPCKVQSITADGNCFFRSISMMLTGSEEYHRKIRLAVVKHLSNNKFLFNSLLREGFQSIDQYISESKMTQVNIWATELEILVTAHLIHTDIITYSEGKWLKYSQCQIPGHNCEHETLNAIYLKHTGECHYEVVSCATVNNTNEKDCTCTHQCSIEKKKSAPKGHRARLSQKKGYMKTKRKSNNHESDCSKAKLRKLANLKETYRQNENLRNKKQYMLNKAYQNTLKNKSKEKYALDETHRENVKMYSKIKYAQNEKHKQNVKNFSKTKYAQNEKYKEKKIKYNQQKYAQDSEYREAMKKRNRLKKDEYNLNLEQMKTVRKAFLENISHGPEYVCSVCHRRLFQNQVKRMQKQHYVKDPALAERCITESYVHTCSPFCETDCEDATTANSKSWICHTCHEKLKEGKVPNQAVVNNLILKPIPQQLKDLNELEQHLIALNIPFMKLMSLPMGGQNGVHGPVVCVPSDIQKVTNVLPRCDNDDQMIRVKLKRKLTYRGHYQYKFVKQSNIEKALTYLKQNNEHYKNIQFNRKWMNPLPTITEEQESEKYEYLDWYDNESIYSDDSDTLRNEFPELYETIKSEKSKNDSESDLDDDITGNDQNGLLMDTCLQPVDIGQEVLDTNLENITCIAPGEGNNPVRLLMDTFHEAKSFPVLFPSGSPTYDDNRDERITLNRYFNTRLMNADGRFARNTDYIFYAQYLTELDQVVSQVSIALRKGMATNATNTVSYDNLTDNESLRKILKNDEGYKFLKPIRGTPPYWQSAQKDLFAMIRQLGIPTWFCSFSSADLRWPDIIESILRESGDYRKASDLDWSQKCSVLRKNPVTTARMFDHRFHAFLQGVIKSPANPIGKVKDYFYRVEFQHRGSPHTHCLFWIENAPKIDENKDKEVVDFVDQYVSCAMPSENDDEELNLIVSSVQRHSKKHSKSCKKKKTKCRFNFPRPPSVETFICRSESRSDDEPDNDETPDDHSVMSKDKAKDILTSVYNIISDSDITFDSTSEMFASIGLSQEIFEKANLVLAKKTSLIHKRHPNDVWVNQYNPELLKCWNANMDIQYVVDAYACVVYIITYISKAEREMGLLLNHCQNEATDGENLDAKSALKKLGAKYLHNRELSAQEAVYRVCNLRLKEGSRKVIFLPTVDTIKMSLPLSELQKKWNKGELDEDDMWMKSIVDKYLNRPDGDEFLNLCLAEFASKYRVLAKSEASKVAKRLNPVVALKNDYGHIMKRSKTDGAVIRYARFCRLRQPEKFYQSILELFLPYRIKSSLKPDEYHTYESFYREGIINTGDDQTETVKEIVDRNRSFFEQNAEEIAIAEEALENGVPLEDAWSQICPETEKERDECEMEMTKENDKSDEDDDIQIPDLLQTQDKQSKTEMVQTIVSKEEACGILKSLNEQQGHVFYQIRQWCLNKKNGENPDPFHIFITGGAGTGKSHLTKAICYEANRLLSQIQPNPDDTSVLMIAPTGVAAFNIGASTIHSAMVIGIETKLPYQPLCSEKINTLRSKLENLHILVIDEISMVNKTLLSYIHGRLRQVKQRPDHSPFGGVSVLAVGDFYQLPPVQGKVLYAEQCGFDLWNDYFKIVELDTIMRQNNPQFAQLLNRLRKHKKHDKLSEGDMITLQSRETGESNLDTLHILATNAQVNDHNVTALHTECSDIVCIKSRNYEKNQNTGKMETKPVTSSTLNRKNTLPDMLYLAIGARVMLTKNLDTSDGLVNGVFGTISFMKQPDNDDMPSKVYVLFDNAKVGQKCRRRNKCINDSVPILPEKEKLGNYGVRNQFPLKLAYACTVHKVQGLTVDKATVSLKKIFAPGQAYVALSRVTSLEGLVIEDFSTDAIYCNEKVKDAMSNMPTFVTNITSFSRNCTGYTFMLHNIQGLKNHIDDIKCDKRYMKADFICLTETWLTPDVEPPVLDGFDFHRKDRALSYQSSHPICESLAIQSHGGVGVYLNNSESTIINDFPVRDLEYMAFSIPDAHLSVAVLYRPNSYTLSVFMKRFHCLIECLENVSPKTIVMGDFNENIFMHSAVCDMMKARGFVQKVLLATTENGTLIDHVYVKNIESISVKVEPTYFSYHEAVSVEIL